MSKGNGFCTCVNMDELPTVNLQTSNHKNVRIAPRSIPHEMLELDKAQDQIYKRFPHRHKQRELQAMMPPVADLHKEIERLNEDLIDKAFAKLIRENYDLLNNQGPVMRGSLITAMHIFSGGDVPIDHMLKAPPVYSLAKKAVLSSAEQDKDSAMKTTNPQAWESKLVQEMGNMCFDPSSVAMGFAPGIHSLRLEDGTVAYFDEWRNPVGQEEAVVWPEKTVSVETTISAFMVDELGRDSCLYAPLQDHRVLFTLTPAELHAGRGHSREYYFRMSLYRANDRTTDGLYLNLALRVCLELDCKHNRIALSSVHQDFVNHLTPNYGDFVKTTNPDEVWARGIDFIWLNENKNKMPAETVVPLPMGYENHGRLNTAVVCYSSVEHTYYYGTDANIPTALVRKGLQKLLEQAKAAPKYNGGFTSKNDRLLQLTDLVAILRKTNVQEDTTTQYEYKGGVLYVKNEYDLNWDKEQTQVRSVCKLQPVPDNSPSNLYQEVWMTHVYELEISLNNSGQAVDFKITPISIEQRHVCVLTPATIECVANYIQRLALQVKTGQSSVF